VDDEAVTVAPQVEAGGAGHNERGGGTGIWPGEKGFVGGQGAAGGSPCQERQSAA
jgi:hypothetical protein